MEKTRNRPKAIINIMSFRGISEGAMHYYGRLQINSDLEIILLKRPIAKEDLSKYPDRFYGYEEGDMVDAFNTWKEVIDAGEKVAKEKKYRFK